MGHETSPHFKNYELRRPLPSPPLPPPYGLSNSPPVLLPGKWPQSPATSLFPPYGHTRATNFIPLVKTRVQAPSPFERCVCFHTTPNTRLIILPLVIRRLYLKLYGRHPQLFPAVSSSLTPPFHPSFDRLDHPLSSSSFTTSPHRTPPRMLNQDLPTRNPRIPPPYPNPQELAKAISTPPALSIVPLHAFLHRMGPILARSYEVIHHTKRKEVLI